jgi:hypothetical protein
LDHVLIIFQIQAHVLYSNFIYDTHTESVIELLFQVIACVHHHISDQLGDVIVDTHTVGAVLSTDIERFDVWSFNQFVFCAVITTCLTQSETDHAKATGKLYVTVQFE